MAWATPCQASWPRYVPQTPWQHGMNVPVTTRSNQEQTYSLCIACSIHASWPHSRRMLHEAFGVSCSVHVDQSMGEVYVCMHTGSVCVINTRH